ncbi:MAG TPA: exodeoxyribonuclease VII large subunit [Acidimicrobiales bacterium]|nr:exodeoxyribonuclease VII large subunit [Acidimicrobiales bacterium]
MARDADDLFGGHPDALTIAELYAEVDSAIAAAFPRHRALWVRGEIQQASDRTGHLYMDLVDPDGRRGRQAPVLKVRCWERTWAPIRRTLRREGLELVPGMVVLLGGKLEFYKPRSEVAFILGELDVTALLGRLAAQRAALLRTLQAEGLLERNRAVPVPAVALRIGLIASPGTEGYRDFVGQLEGSGFAFRVTLARASVQGAGAPTALARAIRRTAASACDVIVVVRGGGSRADLAAFDTEPVARAIAGAETPVWTGIGHTGDESVADVVANRSFVTPTDCGRELVQRVGAWHAEHVVRPAEQVARRAVQVTDAAGQRDNAVRGRVAAAARHHLRFGRERLTGRVGALGVLAPASLGQAEHSTRRRAGLLGPAANRHLDDAGVRLDGWRRLLAAYDVERQLERGYTLTLDEDGRTVTSVAGLAVGADLVTRFADGTARSTVTELSPGAGGGR